jgi:hydroxyethylthiazole kinase-like uncharacterized protein yjeF
VHSNSLPPALTGYQVREIDHLTSERWQIPLSWLMEAAGWHVARHCLEPAYVVCGRGNNGGDGFAAARHLHRWGRLAGVACIDLDHLSPLAAQEAAILNRLGIRVDSRLDPPDATLIVDALLGTGLSRPPVGMVADWIDAINGWGRKVVSVDLPSGLDGDTGQAHRPCIRATFTVTLGLPKAGLLTGCGPDQAGAIWMVDIGIPHEAYRAVGIDLSSWSAVLAASDSVRIA